MLIENIGWSTFSHLIVQEAGKIEGQENHKEHITKFYNYLVHQRSPYSALDISWFDDTPQVKPEENQFLTSRFTEKETHDAIFDTKHNKALVPNGFMAEFYQKF